LAVALYTSFDEGMMYIINWPIPQSFWRLCEILILVMQVPFFIDLNNSFTATASCIPITLAKFLSNNVVRNRFFKSPILHGISMLTRNLKLLDNGGIQILKGGKFYYIAKPYTLTIMYIVLESYLYVAVPIF
jgi:hypothetical protein